MFLMIYVILGGAALAAGVPFGVVVLLALLVGMGTQAIVLEYGRAHR